MKNRKMRLIIGMLIGLVLFSSSVALLMYTKINKEEPKSVASVEVYVASKHISRGEKIVARDLTKASLPKSYLAFTPLTASEIIGRYATVDIFAKEPMRKEKLSLSRPVDKKVVAKVEKKKKVEEDEILEPVQKGVNSDTLTVSLSLFSNIDSSLKVGDTIDIISVLTSNGVKFKSKYVALHLPIYAFVKNNMRVGSYLFKSGENMATADSIVFSMTPNEIKNFLDMHYTTQELNENRVLANPGNRGHLWMVKCSNEENKNLTKVKEHMMVDYKQKIIKRQRQRKKKKETVSISYE